jgi:hypothetical protein
MIEAHMDENGRRRVAIAQELVTWGADLPTVMSRITEISKRFDVSGRLELDFETKARQMTMLFNALDKTSDFKANDEVPYDRLIENTDRLRDLIASTNAALDGLPATVANASSRSNKYPSKPNIG